MEQENTNSLLKLFDPKFLRPLMYQVIPQLPRYLLQQRSMPPSTPLEGRYKPSFLERAAFVAQTLLMRAMGIILRKN